MTTTTATSHDLDDPDGLLGRAPGGVASTRNGDGRSYADDEDLDLLGDVDPGSDLDDEPAVVVEGADRFDRSVACPRPGEARR